MQKRYLTGAMQFKGKHVCRSEYPTEAAAFEFEAEGAQNAFRGKFEMTIQPFRENQGADEELDEELDEDCMKTNVVIKKKSESGLLQVRAEVLTVSRELMNP